MVVGLAGYFYLTQSKQGNNQMSTNFDRYKRDLKRLIQEGGQLRIAIEFEYFPEKLLAEFKRRGIENPEGLFAKLPKFDDKYQGWYSESLAVIRQLLQDRTNDFIKLYERPKNRKEVTVENYTIEDYLHGLYRKNNVGEILVDGTAAIPKIHQQLSILEAVLRVFESSLFSIRQLAQADLFDSELEAAKELNENGFVRAAGAVAGVVLEKHLAQVSKNHNLVINKHAPTINDYNQLIKNANIIEIADWRFIQRLGDLRNLCDHDKGREPHKEEITELVEGVEKIIKRVF